MWNAVGLQPHTLLQCSSTYNIGGIMYELKKIVHIFSKTFLFFSYFEEKLYKEEKKIILREKFSKIVSSQTQFYKVHLCTLYTVIKIKQVTDNYFVLNL